MRRRAFLTLAGTGIATALAGCSGDGSGDDESDGGSGDGDGPAEDGAADDGADESSDATTESGWRGAGYERGYEPITEGDPDVRITDTRLVGEAEGYEYDGFAAVTVENRGDGAASNVDLTVEWFDEGGELLDEGDDGLEFIRAGETWEARIMHDVGDIDRIDDVAAAVEVDEWRPRIVEELHVEETAVETKPSTGVTRIDTTIINHGDETVDFWTPVGRIFDDDGNLLGDTPDHVSDTEVGPGEEWNEEIPVALYQMEASTHHEVVPEA